MPLKYRASRVLAAIVAATTVGALSAEACGFPDVSFAPRDEAGTAAGEGGTDAAGGTDGPSTDGRAGDAGQDAKFNPDVDLEAGTDAATAGDAAVPIDASGCMTCDCDEDGYNRLDMPAGCDGGPGKTDCDDNIKAIHPDQGYLTDPWPAGSKHNVVGDWDCSGGTLRNQEYDGNCEALSPCKNGFVGNPPCGGTAAYLTCTPPGVPLPVLCSTKTTESAGMRTQGCR